MEVLGLGDVSGVVVLGDVHRIEAELDRSRLQQPALDAYQQTGGAEVHATSLYTRLRCSSLGRGT